MKKSVIITTLLAVAVLMLGLSAYADDHSAEMAALQQQAERIQNQINLTQQQCGANLNSQLKPLSDSIESLVKQRVQLGAQIQQMESQIQDLKQSTLSTCNRQVKQHEEELAAVKQQIANRMAQKNAEATQKANNEATKPPAQATTAPAPVAPGAPGLRKP
jgi:chromosome segregation ATPase